MTDATISSSPIRTIDVTSDKAARHLKRRYAREARFKAYGLAAILFSALFVVVLVADIVIKALPAATVSHLNVDVPVKADLIDPAGSKDPTVIATGDFDKAAREALFAVFPEAAKDRKSRKVIQSLLSTGATDDLRAKVMADPSLIGTTVPTELQLSSDADLYVRGVSAGTRTLPGTAKATPSATSGAVRIDFDADVLGTELTTLRATLLRDSETAQREADAASARLTEYKDQLAKAAAGAAADKLKADVAALEGQIATLSAKAKEKLDRAKATSGSEALDATTPSLFVALDGGMIKAATVGANFVEGETLLPLKSSAASLSGQWSMLVVDTPEESRKITDSQIAYLEALRQTGAIETGFNWGFFTSGDSREAELAGILSSLTGSALTMLVTLAICLPIGVMAAIYLEEFAPKNRLTDLVEVNISNLAAVPSIVFGLLGLAVFIGFFGIPPSSPLVGGLVLSLLVLPTIIIASRAALKAVPPSIREAALGIGASKQQAVFHHVLPLAMPGILTGTIIGMAHALGETAPLLMIGMIAFIVDVPTAVTSPSTVLPVQIFLWSDLPELGFQAKTAAAILVLLAFLFVMNGLAILLRKRFERRW
ncbi:MAG: phosphate ABC transporter permease PstA [Hyphomicrobiaceae bacterium]